MPRGTQTAEIKPERLLPLLWFGNALVLSAIRPAPLEGFYDVPNSMVVFVAASLIRTGRRRYFVSSSEELVFLCLSVYLSICAEVYVRVVVGMMLQHIRRRRQQREVGACARAESAGETHASFSFLLSSSVSPHMPFCSAESSSTTPTRAHSLLNIATGNGRSKDLTYVELRCRRSAVTVLRGREGKDVQTHKHDSGRRSSA